MLSFTFVLLCVFTVGVVTGVFDLEADAATTYYEAIDPMVKIRHGSSSDYGVAREVPKGTVVKVVGSTVNSSNKLWYQLSDGKWVYSERVKKHTHNLLVCFQKMVIYHLLRGYLSDIMAKLFQFLKKNIQVHQ
jgi:hypothetical protein